MGYSKCLQFCPDYIIISTYLFVGLDDTTDLSLCECGSHKLLQIVISEQWYNCIIIETIQTILKDVMCFRVSKYRSHWVSILPPWLSMGVVHLDRQQEYDVRVSTYLTPLSHRLVSFRRILTPGCSSESHKTLCSSKVSLP